MNTLVATNKRGETRRLVLEVLGVGLLLGMVACATTRQVSKVETSGFLGDYSDLQKGKKGQAALVYINPNANWAQYSKVYVQPVQLWASDDPDSAMGKLSPETQQRLIDLLNTALVEQLQNDYEIVSQPGPDTLVIRAAITDAKHSKPVINLVSSVYLPLKVVSFGKQLVTGTGIGVGAVQVECEIQDGQTNQRLAAVVDRRAGTKALRSKFDGPWGDVKLSFDWWATRLRTRLSEERQGVPDKTDL
jgi:Protein of unknown function (DUF3313)